MCAQCLVGLNYAYLTPITGKCESCIKTVFFKYFFNTNKGFPTI